jgi:hypothetical protein
MDESLSDCEQWKVPCWRSSVAQRVCAVLGVAFVFGLATKVCAGQTAIAPKRDHNFRISLTTKSGKLVAEKDEYCAIFNRTNDDEPTLVLKVSSWTLRSRWEGFEKPRDTSLFHGTILDDTAGLSISANNPINRFLIMLKFITLTVSGREEGVTSS